MRQKPAAKYELISNEIEQSNDEKKSPFRKSRPTS